MGFMMIAIKFTGNNYNLCLLVSWFIYSDCLRFTFFNLIKDDLKAVVHMWNTHYIRGSRGDTLKGKPNELYFLPELVGNN